MRPRQTDRQTTSTNVRITFMSELCIQVIESKGIVITVLREIRGERARVRSRKEISRLGLWR